MVTAVAQPQSNPVDYRPRFHFSSAKNWINDPSGLVYDGSEYHLFYQYNPFGDQWGHMSWGHSVSKDLTRWQQLPVALPEENGIMIFTGSAVIDSRNTSGFGGSSGVPMVAVYTGNSKGSQTQNIAYSSDRGRTWAKFAGNPVIDIHEAEFRDPMVFWHQSSQRWIMTVSLAKAHKVRFYASTDLKNWSQLSPVQLSAIQVKCGRCRVHAIPAGQLCRRRPQILRYWLLAAPILPPILKAGTDFIEGESVD